MSNSLSLSPQTLLEDVLLWYVQRLELVSLHNVFWSVLHQLQSSPSRIIKLYLAYVFTGMNS